MFQVDTESETPVTRLLQESKDNHSVQLLHHSNSCTSTPSSRDNSDKGKRPLVKSKTLETFFRRLPAGARTAARCASEPRPGVSERPVLRHGQTSVNSVSKRPESAPVTEKENVPEIVPESSLVGTSSVFYEDIEIGETYCRGSVPSREEVEIGETYTKDLPNVEIVETVSVHSDGSDSVIVCDDLDGQGTKNNIDRDSRFKPIQACPKTPPRAVSNTVQLEPCVVRITPRVLFSTSCFSTTHFPIVSSCVTPGSKHQADQQNADMGSLKSKFLGEEDLHSLKTSCAIDGGLSTGEDSFSKRARSASPPTRRVLPRSHHSYDDSHRSPYSRSSLKEFRHQASHHSPVKETGSDCEGVTPVHLLNGDGSEVKKFSNSVNSLRELKTVYEHERLGLGESETRVNDWNKAPASQSVSSSGVNKNGNSLSPDGLKNSGQPVSSSGAQHGSRSVSPSGAQDGDRSASPQPSTSSVPSASSSASSLVPSPPKPLGIFNPATVPQWTGALYTDTVKGKGKRLVKSVNAAISNRNSPKLTDKVLYKGKKVSSSDSSVAAQNLQHISKTLLPNGKDCTDDQATELVHTHDVNQHKTLQKSHSRSRAGSDWVEQAKEFGVANGADQHKTLQKGQSRSRAGSDCVDGQVKDLGRANGVDQHKTPQKGHSRSRAGSDCIDQAREPGHANGADQHKTPQKGQSRSRAGSDCVDDQAKDLGRANSVDQHKTPQKGHSRSRAGSDCVDQAKEPGLANGSDQHRTLQKGRSRNRAGSGRKANSDDCKGLKAKPVSKFPSLHDADLTSTEKEISRPVKRRAPHKTTCDDEADEKNDAETAADLTQNDYNGNTTKASVTQNGSTTITLDKETDTSDKLDQQTDTSGKLVRRVKRQNTGKTRTTQDASKPLEPAVTSSKPSKYGKKSSKASDSLKTMRKNISPQRSIKDWFSPEQTRNHVCSTKTTATTSKSLPVPSTRKTGGNKRIKVLTSSSEVSNLSSASSSVAVSPEKLGIRASGRTKKANPKFDVLLLTRKLEQIEASPSKVKNTISTTTSASAKPLKRKLADTPVKTTPVKMRRLTPSRTPEKRNDSGCHSIAEDFLSSGEEEEEEGLTQEERDLRLALRLQRQFDLADKLNLNIVRFKGTNDQYSLRKSRSNMQL